MVYKLTNFNPTKWLRPLAMTLGLLLLVGSVMEVQAQTCGFTENTENADGQTQLPGTNQNVNFYDIGDVILDASGFESICTNNLDDDFFTNTCSLYFYSEDDYVNGVAQNSGCYDFDCDDVEETDFFIYVGVGTTNTVANNERFVAIRVSGVMDETGPVFNSLPSISSPLNCNDSRVPQSMASASDCGGTVQIPVADITYRDALTSASGGTQFYTRIWTATDASGNTGTATQTYQVQDEGNAPSFVDPDGKLFDAVELSCGDRIPAFNPPAVDFDNGSSSDCPSVVSVRRAGRRFTPNPRVTDEDDPMFYNYTVTDTYRATDAFGNFTSSTKDYNYSDTGAPEITAVHRDLGVPSRVGSTDVYTYSATDVIKLSVNPSANCFASTTFNITADDDCASSTLINYEYRVLEQGSNFVLFNSGSRGVNPNNGIGTFTVSNLSPGLEYVVEISFSDVVGNMSTVSAFIEVEPVTPRVSCSAISEVRLDNFGSRTLLASELLDTPMPQQFCSYSQLTYELRVDQGAYSTPMAGTGSNSEPPAGLLIDFNCSDIGQTRTVDLRITNASGGEFICSNDIMVMQGSSGSTLTAGAPQVQAANVGQSDGKIQLSVSGNAGSYTYRLRGPVNRTVVDGTSTTVDRLPSGEYDITIISNDGCSSTTIDDVYVPVDDPIDIQFDRCVDGFTGSTISIPVRVVGFNEMNGLSFTLNLSGGAVFADAKERALFSNATVETAPNGDNTKATFRWTYSASQGDDFLVIGNTNNTVVVMDVDIKLPDNIGSYGITFGNMPVDLVASQFQGDGDRSTISVTINETPCNADVDDNPAAISGNISYCTPDGVGVDDVTLTLNAAAGGSTMSNNGAYSIPVSSNSVTLTPTRDATNTSITGVVNVIDLIQVQRYLLPGLSSPIDPATDADDAYKLIAANINGNNGIDSDDLRRMNDIASGRGDEMKFWKFVLEGSITNPTNPFA
ncbi:MAG: hypothetical protein AB8G22_24885, partial [Saprospiraceae bacterium]